MADTPSGQGLVEVRAMVAAPVAKVRRVGDDDTEGTPLPVARRMVTFVMPNPQAPAASRN
ncbi:MAG: hypothetical protein HYY50_04550 [Candidatus Kerfeldbacteria bacterium]|nr:hypothetical protein [Candidatus Kerfeldbacteria bacterium]